MGLGPKVLVYGGEDVDTGALYGDAYWFFAVNYSWAPVVLAQPLPAVAGHTLNILSGVCAVAFGGVWASAAGSGNISATTLVLNVTSGEWRMLDAGPVSIHFGMLGHEMASF